MIKRSFKFCHPHANDRLSFWGQNKDGWIVEGLLAALFIGLAFFILFFSWMSTTTIFMHLKGLSYVGALFITIIVMVITYVWMVRYRKRRFQRGGRDYLLMRNLMKTCLTKDCGQIETLLSTPGYSDIEIFNQMYLCQLQHILNHEGLRIRDIHARFEKSRIKRLNGVRFEVFFDDVRTYNQRPLPEEFDTVFKAVGAVAPQLQNQLSQLNICRRDLFTSMSDYLDILEVSQKETEKLQRVYCYNPPKYQAAQKIVFVKKAIDYLKDHHQDRLSDTQRSAMKAIAAEKISKLKKALSDYHDAWKDLVTAYERLPL